MGGLSQLQQTDDKHKLSCFIPTSIPFFYPMLDERGEATNPRLTDAGTRLNGSASNFAPQRGTWWKGHQASMAESTFPCPPLRSDGSWKQWKKNIKITHTAAKQKKYPGWRGWESPRRGDRRENSSELLNTSFPQSQWQRADVCTTTPDSIE